MADDPRFYPTGESPTAEEAIAALEAYDAPLSSDDDVVVSTQIPPPVGRSWAFSFDGEIVGYALRDGAALNPVATYGDGTLLTWIAKTLHTAKGAHPIYPSDYGMERPFEFIGKTMTTHDYTVLQSRIHDALTYHPRIVDVTDFAFTFDDAMEALHAAFSIVKDDDSSESFAVNLSRVSEGLDA